MAQLPEEPSPEELQGRLLALLRAQLTPCPGRIVLGLSGGLDSTVLLAALVRAGLGERVRAVHVHHGLQAGADAWASHCAGLTDACGVSLEVARLELAGGGNLEERAREARHRVLFEYLDAAGDVLLLAHHRDDQAETLLLRLLRGAGPRGLAGMAPVDAGRRLLRPLLGFSRGELEILARHWELSWAEDPSNHLPEADRNFLRHRVLPVLAERWPAVRATLARDATVQRDTAALLDELCNEDLQRLSDCRGGVDITGLRALSAPRRRNLLHGLIRRRGLRPPSGALLQRVEHELLPAAADRQPQVAWPRGAFRRHRGRLYLLRREELEPLRGRVQLVPGEHSQWSLGPLRVHLDQVEAGEQSGLLLPLDVGPLFAGPARGGERILFDGMHRRVAELWRRAGVPPWQRRRLPLFHAGEELVAVDAVGVADPWRVPRGRRAWRIRVDPCAS